MDPEPDPLVRGTDPGIRIRTKKCHGSLTLFLNVVFFGAGFEGLVDPDQQRDFNQSLVENWVVEFIEDLIGIKTLWMHDSFSVTIKSATTNHMLFY